MEVDKDAFSSGQIGSKIWLCENLEEIFESVDNIYIYGGWYGISAFLLKSRNKIKINTIRSFDIDPNCEPVADMINENWVYQNWQFKAFTKDCNEIIPDNVDLIINTSTEHFESTKWFDNIPNGTCVALQGNNMKHEDHHTTTDDLDSFLNQFIISDIWFKGQKDFVYPDWQFSRYMIIGKK
jgi:hypothetical protein